MQGVAPTLHLTMANRDARRLLEMLQQQLSFAASMPLCIHVRGLGLSCEVFRFVILGV